MGLFNISNYKNDSKGLFGANGETTKDGEALTFFKQIREIISQSLNLDRISLFFGNGSSIYAGSKSIQIPDQPLFDDQSQKEFVKNILGKIKGEQTEKLLSDLQLSSDFAQFFGLKEEKEEIDKALQSAKDQFLSQKVLNIDYSNLQLHQILLLKLRYLGLLTKTSIFTTNYDLCFEKELEKASIEYCNGFVGFTFRHFDSKSFHQSDNLKLYKIHGSINWVIDSNGYDILEKQLQSPEEIEKNKNSALIYPCKNKISETFNSPYSVLMREMLDTFEEKSNCIIVVGYSFCDSHINDIFTKAFANPKNVFFFFDYADDSKNDFLNKVKELGKEMPNINVLSGPVFSSFQNFTKYIFPSIPQKNDEENLVELLQKVFSK